MFYRFLSAFLILGLSLFTPFPAATASTSSIVEFRKCEKPGQVSKAKSGYEVACTRGINGKLLWVYIDFQKSSPGEPKMRACPIAGDRKVFRYWSGNPSDWRQAQFVCALLTPELIKSIKSRPDICVLRNSSSDYSSTDEKGRCDFAPLKVGQKMWFSVDNGISGTNNNILTDEESNAIQAVIYSTKDTPQIPSCYLERSCGPKRMDDLQKVITDYPKTIVFPALKNPLNTPAPILGEIAEVKNCFGTHWCRNLQTSSEVTQIVIEGKKDEWNTYGISNKISGFFFKLTSPSGKVEFSEKHKIPNAYDYFTWAVGETGFWNVQIAGWNGTQQTSWSSPKSVQVLSLQTPQDDVAAANCANNVGSEIKVEYANGMITFANPFNCSIKVVVSGHVNCKATWIASPVSATFAMKSRESMTWGLGGMFPNAISACKNSMTLAGLTYDGSGGLTLCADKACRSSLLLRGRVS